MTTSTRDELLHLATGVAHGEIRHGLADEIVPLVASEKCSNSLAVFSALVEAVASDALAETSRLLGLLTREEHAA